MVVRSTVSAVVSRMPYSDRLPEVVKMVLDDGKGTLRQGILAKKTEVSLSPKEKVHNRMMDKRIAASPVSKHSELAVLAVPATHVSQIIEEDETVRETGSVTMKKTVMQQYLDEQNAKFDDLINKNLGEVLKQQNKYEEEIGWRALVFDLAMARNASDVSSGVSLLIQRATKTLYSYVTFSEMKPTTALEQVIVCSDPASFDALMDSMDYNEKVMLFRRLHQDLSIDCDTDMARFPSFSIGTDTPLVDKIQMMVILLIRLAFIGFKLFIPITTAVYTKFKNNELLFVNSRNFDRLLNTVIHMMENMEERLDYETVRTKDGKGTLSNDEAIKYLGNFKGIGFPGSDSWAASIARYTISKYTRDGTANQDFAADPRFAQYFTDGRRPQNDSDEDNYVDAVEGHPSVFQVALQFASEMA